MDIAYDGRHEPKKDQITAIAVNYLQDFIESVFAEKIEDKKTRKLTSRERQILELLAKGFEAKEIAESLGMIKNSVYSYTSLICSKIGVENKAQAVILFKEGKI